MRGKGTVDGDMINMGNILEGYLGNQSLEAPLGTNCPLIFVRGFKSSAVWTNEGQGKAAWLGGDICILHCG